MRSMHRKILLFLEKCSHIYKLSELWNQAGSSKRGQERDDRQARSIIVTPPTLPMTQITDLCSQLAKCSYLTQAIYG